MAVWAGQLCLYWPHSFASGQRSPVAANGAERCFTLLSGAAMTRGQQSSASAVHQSRLVISLLRVPVRGASGRSGSGALREPISSQSEIQLRAPLPVASVAP